jgi:hypothetical protein
MTLLAQFAATGGTSAYIEDVFRTWLYTGNGTTQTINNGVNLAGRGGMVWVKSRSAATNSFLFDTTRGALNEVNSNTSDAQLSLASSLTAFNTNGFSLGSAAGINTNADTYVSWAFREQAQFFDVVNYTGTGVNRTVAHNLNSVPGCIMVKRTDIAGDWQVFHRITGNTRYLVLNSTAASTTGAARWNNTSPTSTVFSLGTDPTVNASGGTYVAYVFAHNAGGFGLSGTDNVISCGEYNGGGSQSFITLGYEPQFVIVKDITSTGNWHVFDNMRGMTASVNSAANTPYVYANTAVAEATAGAQCRITPTGFTVQGDIDGEFSQYIYIAVRRGPMRVPTTGTSVFGLSARDGTSANATVTGGQIDDLAIIKNRASAQIPLWASRLDGVNYLASSSTAAVVAAGVTILQASPWDVMDGVKIGTTSVLTNASANTFINYLFSRAPSFMDTSTYRGNGTAQTVSHNLTVVPEMIIVKRRDATNSWGVYHAALGKDAYLSLNGTGVPDLASTAWNSVAPTSSVFSVGNASTNTNGGTYIAHLFASCPGVSRLGSFTGTGATQIINCGFTSGARFVLIRSTSATGDWYVWDSARGIVVGNDPYFQMNSTAVEVTSTDWVNTAASGFELSSVGGNLANSSGVSYIFLAIA